LQKQSGDKISVCYIVGAGEADWLKLSLESIDYLADEVIIILDHNADYETMMMLDEVADKRYKVIRHKWPSSVGDQMNQFFKYATGDWILQLDADEVLSDKGYLLREYMNKEFDCYNLSMIHFVYNFGLIDSTKPKHTVLRRFYKRTDRLFYPSTKHTVLSGVKMVGDIEDVVVYHFCHAKRMMRHVKAYESNLKDSKVHKKEFLDWWYKSILFNSYPVTPYVGDYPSSIKRRFHI